MYTLTLTQMQDLIAAAFMHFLAGEGTGVLQIELQDVGNIDITIDVRNGRFDCGVPGYNLDNDDVPDLRIWTGKAITTRIGNVNLVGGMAPCKMVGQTGQVNVVLRDPSGKLIFNFHVNLTDPC